MPITPFNVAVCVAVASFAYGLLLALRRRLRLPYPPGPPGYPIIGNLTLPHDPLWEKVTAMSDEYGSDVIRFRLLGQDMVFLNSYEAATELMDKRSTIYSDRPVDGLVMFRELAGMGWQFSIWKYGSEWRDGRKAFHHELRQQVVPKFRPAQKRGAYHLLRSLLQSPEDFFQHCRHLAGRVIMDIGYGIDVQDKNDHWIDIAEHALEGASVTLTPGAFYVDFIPILKYVPEWVPGAGFQKTARAYRKSSLFLLNGPFQYVKDQMAQNDPDSLRTSAAKSLIQNVINKSDDAAYTERVVKSALGTMYGAGAETVGTAMQMFVLCMVLHPDAQKKAQAEIDNVCGGRLPDFSDYDRLPYVLAVVKETMRWLPILRLNPPHRLMQDDQYRGYHISAGSIVIVNNWALLRNADFYPNPEQYNPGRFLKRNPDGTQAFNPDVLDPEVAGIYGWGHRICPGRYLANEEFWIAAACLLATFDISKARDEKGEPITPKVEVVNGLLNHTLPFPCTIRPRSAEHAELILNAEV